MQTILGANGVIGEALARSLPQYTDRIRLAGRSPRTVNPTDQLQKADLLDAAQADAAVKGSKVAYLTAGLPYKLPVWQRDWPVLMRNVVAACRKHQTRLVFFDNVYAYGKVDGWMTEDTPHRPVSGKGEVRARIADMLLEEMAKGRLEGQIVRSADFYGVTPLSFVYALVFDNLAKGKKPQWMVNADVRHSFTYTTDAGRATALLGNTDAAYNQIWHLPTDRNALTGRQIMALAAAAFQKPEGFTVLPPWMLRMIGWFVPVVGENMEMLYQYNSDYLFDSQKFERQFALRPTPYAEGIAEIARHMRSRAGAGK